MTPAPQPPERPPTDPRPVPPPGDDRIAEARVLLAGPGPVLVLTGAGISAASGVPTFRGEEGLWKGHRPEELATPQAFGRDPRKVWAWYGWRRELVAGCEPNAAHLALARWSRERDDVWIATQNVDGLHGRALERVAGGASAGGGRTAEAHRPTAGARDRILELHGSLFRTRCTGCGRKAEDRGAVDASSRETLPRCGTCGGLLRPDVVWFGEPLVPEVVDRAAGVARRAGSCLVVGTSAVVQPAASLATLAAGTGAGLVEVNPEPTPLTPRAGVSLRAGAAETVPSLLEPRER